MSSMDLDTKRKLREMGADPLLAAIEAEDETLAVGIEKTAGGSRAT